MVRAEQFYKEYYIGNIYICTGMFVCKKIFERSTNV